jgi:hypothetical protein
MALQEHNIKKLTSSEVILALNTAKSCASTESGEHRFAVSECLRITFNSLHHDHSVTPALVNYAAWSRMRLQRYSQFQDTMEVFPLCALKIIHRVQPKVEPRWIFLR